MTLEQVRYVILHELAHLAVGRMEDGWHGIRWGATLVRACGEAGVDHSVGAAELDRLVT